MGETLVKPIESVEQKFKVLKGRQKKLAKI